MADNEYGKPVKVEREDVGERVTQVRVATSEHILDPNHELAVQVPEGVGASGVEDDPVGSVYDEGDAEAQFRAGKADSVVTAEEPESKRTVEAREQRAERGKRAARSAKGEDA